MEAHFLTPLPPPIMLYYCHTCELEYDSHPELTLETCPACGKELEERSEPAQCAHQFVRVGPDEDGWVQRRCEKCGEFE